jgi:predicted Zn-dependent protease
MNRFHSRHPTLIRHVAFVAFAALAGLAGCVRNPATGQVHATIISEKTERKIGEETKKQILEEYKVVNSTVVTAYVTRVGLRLAAVCDRPTINYDFTVLDSDVINAFAAPGGFIFVTRGLLERIDDESELAMVLGHEIGHVCAMHGVQMIQQELGQNALLILGSVGAAVVAGPEAMLMVMQTANLFSSLYLLGYSRQRELQADNLGFQYMMRAGYDPHGALIFMKKLQQVDSDEAKGWDLYFRTHPSTTERIAIIESMLGTEVATRPNIANFKEIKTYLPKVSLSDRGVINGQDYANAVYDLRISVPENWHLDFSVSQALASFKTKDGEGEGRLQVVDLSSMTLTAGDLERQYAKAQGFEIINGRDVLYPAGYGFLGLYEGPSASGRPIGIKLFATIRHHRGFIIFCGSPPEKTESYSLDFEQIIRSLKFGQMR